MMVGTSYVREFYFNRQDLTIINGEPMFAALHNMVLQLKSNTVSVLCMIGGGACRYTDIILSHVTYANIAPMNPFIVTAPLVPFNGMNNTTQYQITHATALNETATHTFCMYQLVQRALIQKVLEALKAKLLTRLRKNITGQVPADIQAFIFHLFQAYKKIIAKQWRKIQRGGHYAL